MPIWFELITLLLATYVVGFGAGWIVWARSASAAEQPAEEIDEGDTGL